MRIVIDEERLHSIILSEVDNGARFNPTKMDVQETFNNLNREYFENKLPMCAIEMISDKKYLGYFHYSGVDKDGNLINPTISINGNYRYLMNEFESVVAHEMIHYNLAFLGIDLDCTHGYEFTYSAKQMNTLFNLNITDKVDVTNMVYNNQTQQVSSEILGYMNSYMNSFKQYMQKIKQESKQTKDKVVYAFYTEMYTFTENMINALNRCIKKRSLNEASRMLQTFMPIKQVNDMVDGFNEYYGKMNTWLNNLEYMNRKKANSMNGKGNISLSYLIYNEYPRLNNKYQKLSSTYNFNSITVTNEFKIIEELKEKIKAQKNNTQGN